MENGINLARLVTSGKGEAEPAAENTTPQGRAPYRRVVVKVI